MNYTHNSHQSKALVVNICIKCNKKFYRDGDLMTFSTSYATPYNNREKLKLENVRTYTEWLVFAGDLCDECVPPMPLAVVKDIELENKRRMEDKFSAIEINKDDKPQEVKNIIGKQENKINKYIKKALIF